MTTTPGTAPVSYPPGARVALRSIREYGHHGRRVGHAVGAIVVVDDPALQVLATPPGSAMITRAGRGSGPNGRQVLNHDWAGDYDERTWIGETVVRVHRPGEPWSVWRWHDGSTWTGDWYGNLESPWTRGPLGFDTQDWALDVVATGAPGSADFAVRFKDDDELAYFVEHDHVTAEQAATVTAAGDRLAEVARSASWPFDADWSAWVPDADWAAVPLPDGVERV